jgi:hypothetical protein
MATKCNYILFGQVATERPPSLANITPNKEIVRTRKRRAVLATHAAKRAGNEALYKKRVNENGDLTVTAAEISAVRGLPGARDIIERSAMLASFFNECDEQHATGDNAVFSLPKHYLDMQNVDFGGST